VGSDEDDLVDAEFLLLLLVWLHSLSDCAKEISEANGLRRGIVGWMQESHIVFLSPKVEFVEEEDRSIATFSCLNRQKSSEEEEERTQPELIVVPIIEERDERLVEREPSTPRASLLPEQELESMILIRLCIARIQDLVHIELTPFFNSCNRAALGRLATFTDANAVNRVEVKSDPPHSP
jgi:hypothetical protein